MSDEPFEVQTSLSDVRRVMSLVARFGGPVVVTVRGGPDASVAEDVAKLSSAFEVMSARISLKGPLNET